MNMSQEVTQPEIAIAMPLGRLSPWFTEALESALAQTHPVPVYLIANALGDPDNQELERIACINPTVKLVVFDDRVPMVDNWNRALKHVKEPYLCMLHDDDMLEPWAIKILSNLVQESPGLGIYFSHERIINGSGEFHKPEAAIEEAASYRLDEPKLRVWALANQICATGFLIDREKANALGGYREEFPYTTDWDLYFSLARIHGACRVDAHGGRYRFDGSSGQISKGFVSDGRAIEEYKRQQLANVRAMSLEPMLLENQRRRALGHFAIRILSEFATSLTPQGKTAIYDAIADAQAARASKFLGSFAYHPLVARGLKWATTIWYGRKLRRSHA